MPIIYHDSSKTFHLFNNEISYIFRIMRNGQLTQLYYGKKIKDREEFDEYLECTARPMAVCTYEGDKTFSLEHIRQEYPVYGTGDMRIPALDLSKDDNHIITFTYDHHEIISGKPDMKDLPHTYVEDINEATTLNIHLVDTIIHTELVLSYTIYENLPVITRHAELINHGNDNVLIHRAMSLSLDLPEADYTMIELTGAWSRERNIRKRDLTEGIQSIGSLRGHSSNNFNPFIALTDRNTDEHQGVAMGFTLVYSGNFLAQAETDTYHVTRITMGIHPHDFLWTLEPEQSFTTPEGIMVYSEQGLNGMSQVFHQLFQKRLVRGKWRDLTRPILVNNWEGTYFDFDEEKIVSMAKTAKELGIELFVLDDGWFGSRNDDTRGLGDWFVNTDKLPNGIAGLSKKIHDLGLKFGFWVELEMINKNSRLFEAHPEWVLHDPNRPISHGRNQYVLDFSNDDVVDYCYDCISKILDESYVDYIKWDMNRSLSEAISSINRPGEVMHRHILGVYKLYQRFIDNYPDILFESCSSGGARFDAGMLYYAPQAWTSDDTDAVERQKIQYGTSLLYPISSMGAHVSAVPNHQLYRMTSLDTRANVAYFGTFGYELDVNLLTDEEKAIIRKQIAFMKEYRHVFQFGTFYRLKSPFESNETIWMSVSDDVSIVGYYRILQEVNVGYRRIQLKGLDENARYTVNDSKRIYYGDELMYAGLILSDASAGETNKAEKQGDFLSRLYIIRKV